MWHSNLGFAEADWLNYAEKARQLFNLIVPNLDSRLSAQARLVRDRDGFEAYRKICQEMNPTLANSSFSMMLEIQKLATVRCKTLEETKNFMLQLERKAAEYLAKWERPLQTI